MTKIILVALNLFALFTYNIFFGGEVEIELRNPENIQAGESFIVEIDINKGDRSGFAKWQQSLPEGFVATPKETAGATFSFKNQDVKIIWMSIPEEENFTISFEVKTDPEMQGYFQLVGQFSFIEDNQRKDISSEASLINVTNATPILAENPSPISIDTAESPEMPEEPEIAMIDSAEIAKDNEEAVIEVPTEEITETITVEGTVANNNGLVISREIIPLEAAKYEVKLTIHKGDLNSFGKVEDYLPPHYVASENESDDGIFTFNKNVVKILWMTLPNQTEINISYFMESTSDELDSGLVHGAFSYLEGDESRQLKLNPTPFENTFAPVLAEEIEEPEIIEANFDSTAEDKTLVEVEIVRPEVAESESIEPKNDEVLTEEITNIPAPEASVSYKVQIAASKKEVTQQYFLERHGMRENVNIEFHKTWYKYTVGGYAVYKQARDRRNEIWAAENKINDAFVTAYNSGERISVQEALMITQQKWFK